MTHRRQVLDADITSMHLVPEYSLSQIQLFRSRAAKNDHALGFRMLTGELGCSPARGLSARMTEMMCTIVYCEEEVGMRRALESPSRSDLEPAAS